MREIYVLRWSPGNFIPIKECYTNRKRAERHLKYANKHISWRRKMLGHQLVLDTLKVKEGPRRYKKCPHAKINGALEIHCSYLENKFITWVDSSVDHPRPKECPMKNVGKLCDTLISLNE